MERNTELLYCKETTENHPLSKKQRLCLERLSKLIAREGGNGKRFKDGHLAIDLDEVEKMLCKSDKRDKRKTPDLAFAAKKGERAKMVVVECKLRVSKVDNISKGDLDKKFTTAVSILTNAIPIYSKNYILIKNQSFQQLRNKLMRKLINSPNYEVTNEESLLKFFPHN
ncbi:hypothetical protein AB9P05_14050 [Roseivirga sp. BDSF3-8]|uniref:hypothetical protein n=1 Tax=Roseivirga sp. BDSF3-8 TaxID=3241598 RepID=UPI00353255C5